MPSVPQAARATATFVARNFYAGAVIPTWNESAWNFADLRTMPLHIEFGGLGLPELLVVAVGCVLLWGVSRFDSK